MSRDYTAFFCMHWPSRLHELSRVDEHRRDALLPHIPRKQLAAAATPMLDIFEGVDHEWYPNENETSEDEEHDRPAATISLKFLKPTHVTFEPFTWLIVVIPAF